MGSNYASKFRETLPLPRNFKQTCEYCVWIFLLFGILGYFQLSPLVQAESLLAPDTPSPMDGEFCVAMNTLRPGVAF